MIIDISLNMTSNDMKIKKMSNFRNRFSNFPIIVRQAEEIFLPEKSSLNLGKFSTL